MVLPTATKDELKAEMDLTIDPDRYTADTVQAYNNALQACEVVYADAAMSGENIYRALDALRDAKAALIEKDQPNWVATFSSMSGDYTVLNAGGEILYADWKTMDQGSLDASENRDDLHLQMTIRLKSDNPDVDPATFWNTLTIKLRSSDKANVPGDPTGGGNTEHNYGWDFSPSSFDGTSTLKVSIPLSKANTNSCGVMDWSDVQRIIVQCFLNTGKATGDRYQYSMSISGVRIVDMTPIDEAKASLTDKVDEVKNITTAGKDAAKVEVFEAALTVAQELLAGTDPHISLYDVNKALTDLTNAYAALNA